MARDLLGRRKGAGVRGGCASSAPLLHGGTQPASSAVSRDAALAAGERIFSAEDMGRVIRARRKELGYTQVEVAEMMGFSPRLVGEIERGRGSVGFDRVVSDAMNLGIDLGAFGR